MKAVWMLIAGYFFSMASAGAEMLRVDGNELEYEIAGNGEQVVLFDAGALTGMRGWDAIWDDLPATITAIRFSRLGEGNSGQCVGQRSAAEHVQEVRSLLTQLQVTQPVVYVGHSLGGMTARDYAARYPGDVRGMLLVDPENPRDVEIIRDIDPQNGPDEIAKVRAEDYRLSDGRWCFLDTIWEKKAAHGFADIGDIPVTLIASVQRSQKPESIFRSEAGRKRWGEIQYEWVSAFPRGNFVTTTQSGHYVQRQEPDLVIHELTRLLARLAPVQGE